MENDDLNDIDDDIDTGIELDKIEVPKKDSIPTSEKPAKDPSSEKPAKTELEIEPEAAPQKPSKLKIIMAATVLGLALVLVLLWQLKIIPFPPASGSGQKSAGAAPAYHALDPIITNLGPNRHVEISLIIRNHTKLKNRTLDIEPVIRDTILTFLTSPGIRKMANEGDFGKLKPHIKNQITNILQTDYNNTIILKELKVY